MNNNFVSEIKPDFYCTQSESVFGSLFKEYERVVFRSLISSFGLDLFIRDQYGGDVDTIHNVRQIGDGSPMTYKNGANATAYDNRGVYSHKDVEGTGTNFQTIKHKARKRYGEDNNNTVQDAYEDKPLGFLGKSKGHPTDRSAELDHVISAKSIHDDRGRVLSGLSTAELADAEDNLQWTNEHLNKSMGADEIPDYIEAHPELPEDVKKRMMDAYNRAKASYEDKINRAYYFDFSNPNCRQFYKDTFTAAGKRGIQMGLRQALGFLLTELWFSIKGQIELCDGTFTGVLSAIKTGSSNWLENARSNYKEIFTKFGEGVISGFVSSLTTTLVNTFLTTSQNAVRIIRQAWASVVESVNILLFNSKQKYLCDRMTAAAKVLASGASVIIGTSVQEMVDIKLAEVGLPADIKSIASTFCGTLATGLLTVSFLFYIDNDPFRKFLDCIYGATTDELRRQGKLFKEYCAKLQQMDMREFQYATDYAYSLALRLQNADSDAEVNKLLKKAQADLGLESPWGDGSLDDTKTKKSQRSLKFPQSVMDLLREYKAEQDAEREKLGTKWQDYDRLFVKWDGRPMNNNTPYFWLKEFCEENNFRFCDIHSLRHFYASALINEGVDAATVSGALGHSTITTTTSIYCHVFNQAQARAGDAIASVLDFKKHDTDKGQPEAV